MSDGAAAAILCSQEGLKRIGGDKSRAIRISASVMRSFSKRTMAEPEKNVAALTAPQAYEIAGIGPEDIHVAEVHDASPMGEIPQAENLGLTPRGLGGVCAEPPISRLADAFRSTRRAAWNRKGIRSVRPVSVNFLNS